DAENETEERQEPKDVGEPRRTRARPGARSELEEHGGDEEPEDGPAAPASVGRKPDAQKQRGERERERDADARPRERRPVSEAHARRPFTTAEWRCSTRDAPRAFRRRLTARQRRS